MATEQQYDEIVAPLLNEAAKLAGELGMSLVARCEWAPGEAGLTRVGDPKSSVAQAMAWWAVHARGNFDAVGLEMLKEFDCSASIFLAPHNHRSATEATQS
jgi:hypothetical protein